MRRCTKSAGAAQRSAAPAFKCTRGPWPPVGGRRFGPRRRWSPGGALDPGRPEEEAVRRGRTGGAVSKVPVDIDVDIGIGIDLDLGLDIKIRIKITISSKRLLLLLTRPSTLG